MKERERLIYRETYKKGVAIRPECLPTTRHCVSKSLQPIEAHMLAAGAVMRGAERLEYHDMRLYFKV